jgi:hypothetical protein
MLLPWVFLRFSSMRWRIAIEKVAVLPVPDWAWAMTSAPEMHGTIALCCIKEGFSKLQQ